MGLVCHLLAGESRENLPTYCPQFCGNQTHHWSHRLHSWDPAGHLRFINPCDFKTLDRFKCSWLATAPAIWNRLPAEILLRERLMAGTLCYKKHSVVFVIDIYVVNMRFITVKSPLF